MFAVIKTFLKMKLSEVKKYFVFLLLLSACGVKPSLSPKEKFRKAMDHYESGEYSDAIVLFKEALVPLLGTNEEIEIRFFLAKSYFNKQEYLRAADAFADFFDTFPASDKAEEALYSEITALYKESPYSNLDQTVTYRAIEALEFYLAEFPEGRFSTEARNLHQELSTKIEQKDFDNLRVFFDMKNYVSAIVYCDNFAKEHPHSSLLAEVLFMKISSLHNLIKRKAADAKDKFLITLLNECMDFMKKYEHDKHSAHVREIYEELSR